MICDLEIPGFKDGARFEFQTKSFEGIFDEYRIDMFGRLYRTSVDGLDSVEYTGEVVFYNSFIECKADFNSGLTAKIELVEESS
tara:strand:- start:559 stop:810 length:252 start_codon:yes stop_codon:yes gene_type:complete